ncbi:hypothetical protein O3M35_012686 [Rhynocoris fuscipes]|uniref:Uncharacterized protein n=1 Tax=Rhynocoris fuscipes TaxID=488301 RepID=A0AAW1CWD2_9HEMI
MKKNELKIYLNCILLAFFSPQTHHYYIIKIYFLRYVGPRLSEPLVVTIYVIWNIH